MLVPLKLKNLKHRKQLTPWCSLKRLISVMQGWIGGERDIYPVVWQWTVSHLSSLGTEEACRETFKHDSTSMNINNSPAKTVNSGCAIIYSKALMKWGQTLDNSAWTLGSFGFPWMVKHLHLCHVHLLFSFFLSFGCVMLIWKSVIIFFSL